MRQYKTAHAIFESCQTGKGWQGCVAGSQEGGTCARQTDALAATPTPAVHADWIRALWAPGPDGHDILPTFAAQPMADRHGAQMGEGGPVALTGEAVVSDFAFGMRLVGDKISHVTSIWHDVQASRALGWA